MEPSGYTDDVIQDLGILITGFAQMSVPPEARDGDAFAAEVPAPRGASALERLIALTGRQP